MEVIFGLEEKSGVDIVNKDLNKESEHKKSSTKFDENVDN